jgi:hypothetical protein
MTRLSPLPTAAQPPKPYAYPAIAVVGALAATAALAVSATYGAPSRAAAAPAAPGSRAVADLNVLHAAPVIANDGDSTEVSLSTYCVGSGAACDVTSAVVRSAAGQGPATQTVMLPADDGSWYANLPGRTAGTYSFSLTTRDGAAHSYPEDPQARLTLAAFAGFQDSVVAALDWNRRATPTRTLLDVPYGPDSDELGRQTEADADVTGPASFVVDGDKIHVVDTAKQRVASFQDGKASFTPLGLREPVDIGVAQDGSFDLLSMRSGGGLTSVRPGSGAAAATPAAVPRGVPSRLVEAGGRALVFVGSGQWLNPRGSDRRPLTAGEQSHTLSSGASRSGDTTVMVADTHERLLLRWRRPDGQLASARITLPPGVRAGTPYTLDVRADGGAIVAYGVWDDSHYGVLVMSLNASGVLSPGSLLLPEPSTELASRFGTVQSSQPGRLVMAEQGTDHFRLAEFVVAP